MSKNYRVMFLRDRNNQPVGCLAIGLTRSRKSVKYQVSVLNPIDQFDRELSRSIALGRLISDPFSVNLTNAVSGMNDISKDVMSNLSKNKLVPNRAARAARRWLKSLDKK